MLEKFGRATSSFGDARFSSLNCGESFLQQVRSRNKLLSFSICGFSRTIDNDNNVLVRTQRQRQFFSINKNDKSVVGMSWVLGLEWDRKTGIDKALCTMHNRESYWPSVALSSFESHYFS